jgi:hypothetical protein
VKRKGILKRRPRQWRCAGVEVVGGLKVSRVGVMVKPWRVGRLVGVVE